MFLAARTVRSRASPELVSGITRLNLVDRVCGIDFVSHGPTVAQSQSFYFSALSQWETIPTWVTLGLNPLRVNKGPPQRPRAPGWGLHPRETMPLQPGFGSEGWGQ
jgi:hypothetical protein